jgi:chromosome segregation ATPase
VNDVLQLKTQLKISNDLLHQKEQIIASLSEEKTNNENSINHLNQSLNNAKNWEQQYHAMVNKTSQMDVLANQFSELKIEYKKKNEECEKLKDTIETLKKQDKENRKSKTTAENSINKKETKSSAVSDKIESVESVKNIMNVEVRNEIDNF